MHTQAIIQEAEVYLAVLDLLTPALHTTLGRGMKENGRFNFEQQGAEIMLTRIVEDDESVEEHMLMPAAA